MTKLTDIAKVIRSKNSSPFELTLDIILREREDFEQLRDQGLINKKLIAELYGIPQSRITKIIYFEPAKSIKIGLYRSIASGAPGDTDVYGAQQHGPLLSLELDLG